MPIYERIGKRGKSYYVFWYEGPRLRAKSFKDKEEANIYSDLKNSYKYRKPDELSEFPKVITLPLQVIKKITGIYFLCKNKQIVYIGKSINIISRISTHSQVMEGEFDSVFYIEVPECYIHEIEQELIHSFDPKLNNGFGARNRGEFTKEDHKNLLQKMERIIYVTQTQKN